MFQTFSNSVVAKIAKRLHCTRICIVVIVFLRGRFSVFCSKGDIKQQFQHQGAVVRKVDNAIHRINHYPVDSVVCFVNTYPVLYPLDSDLSGG